MNPTNSSLPLVVILVLWTSIVSASIVRIKECHGVEPKAKINSIDVDPCEGAPRGCKFKRGTQPKLTIKFTPEEEVTSATIQINAIIRGATTVFAHPKGDVACDNGMLTCPIPAGEEATMNTELDIKKSYPKVPLVVEWFVFNQRNETLFCFVVRAVVN